MEVVNHQITRLALSITNEGEATEETDLCSSVAFQLVLSSYRGLLDLRFRGTKLSLSREFSHGRLSPSCCSSILTKLDIQVYNFADCLLLLDGRFESLSTCLVLMNKLGPESAGVDNTVSEIVPSFRLNRFVFHRRHFLSSHLSRSRVIRSLITTMTCWYHCCVACAI